MQKSSICLHGHQAPARLPDSGLFNEAGAVCQSETSQHDFTAARSCMYYYSRSTRVAEEEEQLLLIRSIQRVSKGIFLYETPLMDSIPNLPARLTLPLALSHFGLFEETCVYGIESDDIVDCQRKVGKVNEMMRSSIS